LIYPHLQKKLTENSAVPEWLRVKAREFVAEFNSLLPVRAKAPPSAWRNRETVNQNSAIPT
jgi:hypothetical protein